MTIAPHSIITARPTVPLRDWEAGHQDELWKGLRSNDLQVVSTDHCPYRNRTLSQPHYYYDPHC